MGLGQKLIESVSRPVHWPEIGIAGLFVFNLLTILISSIAEYKIPGFSLYDLMTPLVLICYGLFILLGIALVFWMLNHLYYQIRSKELHKIQKTLFKSLIISFFLILNFGLNIFAQYYLSMAHRSYGD